METKNNSVYSIESIEKNIDNLSQELKSVLNNKMQKLKLTNSDFIQALENKEKDVHPLEYLFKIEELNSKKALTLPPIINLEGISQNKAKNIAEILSEKFGAKFITTKYTTGFLEKFIETLENVGKKPKKHIQRIKNTHF